jgi:uncharacterized protein (DUF39 family)
MRSYEEINQRIRSGDAVVITAEEAVALVRKEGVAKAAKEVDVVTTGTFGAMCSSGAFLNFGHAEPPIKMKNITLNGVPAYDGLAAVDAYIGATALKADGKMDYGGAHVIEDLVAGKAVKLKANSYGTDCYPRKEIETYVSLRTMNQAYLYNPRNCYQNYAAATNASDRTLFTYMGKLLPNFKNITYSSAGQLSPLLKDPELRSIGIGTRIFIGGAQGYVSWEGTQYKTNVPMKEGVPTASARTLAVTGDLRSMSPDFVRALTFHKYGTSLGLGIGIPIPILDEKMMLHASLGDEQLFAPILDYSIETRNKRPLREVSYAELRSGQVNFQGKKVRTSSLSSYSKARDVAEMLKKWIREKEFFLTEPLQALPAEKSMKPLDIRTEGEA